MRPLQTKNDLIALVQSLLSPRYASTCRMFHEGTVENLGGFECIPPTDKPGWVLRVVSSFKKIHYLAAVVDKFRHYVFLIDKPPWKYWEGDKSDNKLYQGDNPEEYKLLRDKELENGKN